MRGWTSWPAHIADAQCSQWFGDCTIGRSDDQTVGRSPDRAAIAADAAGVVEGRDSSWRLHAQVTTAFTIRIWMNLRSMKYGTADTGNR